MISDKKTDIIRNKLLEWGSTNYRSFPWRETNNPYEVLLAEMMLHRTSSDQVAKIYEKFLVKYPDPKSIYVASMSDLKKDLKSLGLIWRVENIKKSMEIIVIKYDGKIPNNLLDLLELPGVGNYIAGAVMCIAFKVKTPLLDSNIVRVLARLNGFEVKEHSRRSKQYLDLITDLIPDVNSDQFLFSILDFAYKICTNDKQKCSDCILQHQCRCYLLKYN